MTQEKQVEIDNTITIMQTLTWMHKVEIMKACEHFHFYDGGPLLDASISRSWEFLDLPHLQAS